MLKGLDAAMQVLGKWREVGMIIISIVWCCGSCQPHNSHNPYKPIQGHCNSNNVQQRSSCAAVYSLGRAIVPYIYHESQRDCSSGTDIHHTLGTSNNMADLSALLASSKNLNSHLSRPDLPSVNLSLDQIEALSRRLVSRQPGTSTDTDRACVSSRPARTP
jgi:hypothetical protein